MAQSFTSEDMTLNSYTILLKDIIVRREILVQPWNVEYCSFFV